MASVTLKFAWRRTVSVNKADILQIRKYLDGELNARAMYELELRAQNDPELMDVMQGMEAAQADHQPQIDHIHQLINDRVAGNKKRIVPMYRYWAAAASILLLLGVGSWWFSREEPNGVMVNITAQDKVKLDTAPLIAKIPVPDLQQGPQIRSVEPAARKRVAETQHMYVKMLPNSTVTASTELADDLVESLKPDSAGLIAANKPQNLNNVVARGYIKRAREQTTGASSHINSSKEVENHPVGNVEQLVQGKVAGLNIQNAPDKKQSGYFGSSEKAIDPNYAFATNLSYKTVSGKITDSRTGNPLVGAVVSIPGKRLAQADINGRFSVAVPQNFSTLTTTYIGYKAGQIKLKNGNYLDVKLEPEENKLAEVAITGYASRVNANQATVSTVDCNENKVFAKEFSEKIAILEKHLTEHLNSETSTVTDAEASRALKFLAQYVNVSIDTIVKKGITYPDLKVFNAEKATWLQWYENNKCNNLK